MLLALWFAGRILAQSYAVPFDSTQGPALQSLLASANCLAPLCSISTLTALGCPEFGKESPILCDSHGRVTILKLTSMGLTGSLTTVVGLLTNLYVLWVDQNFLTNTIPSEIGLLTSVTSLALTSNRLVGTVPQAISLLTSLTELGIEGNMLTGAVPMLSTTIQSGFCFFQSSGGLNCIDIPNSPDCMQNGGKCGCYDAGTPISCAPAPVPTPAVSSGAAGSAALPTAGGGGGSSTNNAAALTMTSLLACGVGLVHFVWEQ